MPMPIPLAAFVTICTITLTGCGESDSATSGNQSSAATNEPAGAKCPACLADAEADDESGTEHVCRVNAKVAAEKPAIAEQSSTPADAEPDPSLPAEPIQISPDPAILQTIVGARPNLNYEFINQDGRTVIPAQYKGKTLVVTSFYTSCPIEEMCPRLTADMGWLARQIPDEMRDDIRLIMISFDPAKDSPEVMKAFGRMRGVDYEVTDLLTGDVENIKAILGDELHVDIEVNPMTNAITTHAMMIQIINPDGYIVVERTANHTESIQMVAQEMVRAATMPFTLPDEAEASEAGSNPTTSTVPGG